MLLCNTRLCSRPPGFAPSLHPTPLPVLCAGKEQVSPALGFWVPFMFFFFFLIA